jgi:SNF family Na+-dependent transporter
MNFIFAKLFEEYRRKNDSPRYSISLYISVVYFFLSFTILLPIKTFIDKKIFNDQIEYEKSSIMIVVSGLMAIILLFVYRIYIKNERILRLVERYKEIKINKVLLYFIIVLIPVILLLLAGIITVYLNGGKILGNEINGLLEQ